jgi:dTDP-4-dehydrorhamnose reductase
VRIAVVGALGRLGAVLASEMAAAGHEVSALTRADLEITDTARVRGVLGDLRPDAIVNACAYNAVDAAETDPDAAYRVNAVGPAILAAVAREQDAVLVHYSTDFVFDGMNGEPYVEDAVTNPLSVYGTSKLAGELEVRRAPRHFVLRVASVFGGVGVRGHVSTIDYFVQSLSQGRVVRAAVDRTVTPTFVPDATRATLALLEGRAPYGLYHCVNGESATWFEVAREIAQLLGVDTTIEPATAATAAVKGARRPLNCALSNRRLCAVFSMPDWRSALRRHVAEYSELTGRVSLAT